MKKIFLIFIFATACTQTVGTSSNLNVSTDISQETTNNVEANLIYENEFGELITQNLTTKKTMIVFWADYWGICREELPLLENKLEELSEEYNILALAHSEVEPTMEWVRNNLNGSLQIGFSTKDLRDSLQVVGQPITIIFDTNGNIISREFGYIP